jgi:anti-sigma-K factor RskA
MNCLGNNKQDNEILLDYCAGTLDLERVGAMEEHARECGECRALIDAQMQVWRALGELTPPEVSPDFDARLYARIARQDAEPALRGRLRAWLRDWPPRALSWKPVLVGAAAAAVVAVGLLLHLPKTPEPSPQIRPEAVDVEQVEVTLDDLDMLTPPPASAGLVSPSPSAGKI